MTQDDLSFDVPSLSFHDRIIISPFHKLPISFAEGALKA